MAVVICITFCGFKKVDINKKRNGSKLSNCCIVVILQDAIVVKPLYVKIYRLLG